MKKSFWDQKIPTLFGLFILALGIGTTTLLTNRGIFFQSNASSANQPQNVRITNITDKSFSVSYSTNEKTSGAVNYGQTTSLGQSALDQRDKDSGKLTSYLIHSITVDNLQPLTKYYFTIISGTNTYYNNNKPFEITTGPPIITNASEEAKITGKIFLPDSNFPSEAIVYVTLDNSQVVSALAQKDGSYDIPLNSIRINDLSSYYKFDKNSVIKMLIYGDLLTSNVVLSKNQINTIPPITLSKDYNFLVEDFPSASPSANFLSFPSLTSTVSAQKVKILTPKENQGFTDDQPLFKGTAKPGESVQIDIHSDEAIQAKVTTDKNGNWSYQPSQPLSPGTHTITITAKDVSGILRTISQSFVVYASGTQIPNASGSPTPTPTPISNTLTSPIPTATYTPTPTIITSQVPTATTSGTPLPPTGNPFIITFGIVGFVISLFGSLLFLLSRKNT